MPIEKMNLALQIITTAATLWLGYVGHELAKAQNQIAEVQTYGLPPTVNKSTIQSNDLIPTEDNMSLVPIKIGLTINNNRTYPIWVKELSFMTLAPFEFDECHSYPDRLISGKSVTQHICTLDETVAPKGDATLALEVFEKQPVGTYANYTIPTGGLTFFYYDPMEDKHSSVRNDFDARYF